MKLSVNSLDKSAITLSTLCVVHCLLLPVLTVLLPTLAATTLNQEFFHIAMVTCVIPISIFALTLGCKKHKNYSIFYIGAIGLVLLLVALVLGEPYLDEIGEKVLTTIGSMIIAFVHIRNFRLCQHAENCAC